MTDYKPDSWNDVRQNGIIINSEVFQYVSTSTETTKSVGPLFQDGEIWGLNLSFSASSDAGPIRVTLEDTAGNRILRETVIDFTDAQIDIDTIVMASELENPEVELKIRNQDSNDFVYYSYRAVWVPIQRGWNTASQSFGTFTTPETFD